MKIRTVEFDGTPEEFRQVGHLFSSAEGSPKPITPATSEANGEAGEIASDTLTVELAELALTRIPLSENQKKIFAVVLAAGAEGILISDVASKVGISRAQLAGTCGALGRRFANTKGWPKGGWLIDPKWNTEHSQWKFWPNPILTQVSERGKVTF